MPQKQFLIAEDDAALRTLLVSLLGVTGVACVAVPNGAIAIDALRRHHFDGLILDLMMPGANGFEVLEFIRCERPHLKHRTIVVTAANDVTLRHFDPNGISTLLKKPFDVNDLLAEVRRIATSAEAAGEKQPPTNRDLQR